MTRVLQRILRRRGATPEEPELEPLDHERAVEPGPDPAAEGVAVPGEATVDPHPSFRSRGAMRRRLRYLRRARELGFRDLGGLVFDLRRFERDRPELVEAKVHALFEVDQELRALEGALGDRRDVTELREPGIASCPRCGALHGSDARFCSSCGLALRGPQPVSEVGDAVPAVLSPPRRPQLAAADRPAPPPDPPRSRPVPARPGQATDEPAPFEHPEEPEADADATADGDEAAEDATKVLEPESDAERAARRRGDDG